jgi:NhaP-type Na+/H+ or K+/H+ antiporter
MESLIIKFSFIPIIGIFANWLSWRLKTPSILILLSAGIVVGPITNFVNPDIIFGNLLFPIVSIAVSIILFEGGLNLKINEIYKLKKIVFNLVTYGLLITWILLSIASYCILKLSLEQSIFWGSILVMTGPTVIIPIVKQLRLKQDISTILKWEGILIDPIGAVLAILVFKGLVAKSVNQAIFIDFSIIFKTIFFGGIIGAIGALFLVTFIKKQWIPNYLQESITLSVVIAIFTLSNVLQGESGLLAVTVMGFILANQKVIHIKRIVLFKENLTLILLSTVFIILASRLDIEHLKMVLNLRMLLFIFVIVFLIRPFSVFVSTFRSKLKISEKLFLSFMAPRGIVVAAITSLFVIKLEKLGYHDAYKLVPLSFCVIISTVSIYGLTSIFLSRILKVKKPPLNGILIIGAHEWARDLGLIFNALNINCLLVDSNRNNIVAAKSENIKAIQGSITSRQVKKIANSLNIGHLFAISDNDEKNILAAKEFLDIFDQRQIYRLNPIDKRVGDKLEIPVKTLFNPSYTYAYLSAKYTSGYKITITKLCKEFTYKDFCNQNPRAIPFIFVSEKNKLSVVTENKKTIPKNSNKIICFTLK